MKNTTSTPHATEPSFAVALPRGFSGGQRPVWNLDAPKRLDPKVTARSLEFRTRGRAALYERVRLSGTKLLCAPAMGPLADAATALRCTTQVAAEIGNCSMPQKSTWKRDVENLASCFGLDPVLVDNLFRRAR